MDILKQFGIDPLLLAAQVVNFTVLLLILKRFLFKPILKVLEERKNKIEDSLKNAEEIEKKLQETNDKVEQMIAKASDEGQKLVSESKKEAALILEETKQNAARTAQEIIKKGQESASIEAEKLKQEILKEMAGVVAVALEKVTSNVLKAKDQKAIIEKEIKNLS